MKLDTEINDPIEEAENDIIALESRVEELENKSDDITKFLTAQSQLIQQFRSNIDALEESLYRTREGIKGVLFIQGIVMVLLFIINLILNLL